MTVCAEVTERVERLPWMATVPTSTARLPARRRERYDLSRTGSAGRRRWCLASSPFEEGDHPPRVNDSPARPGRSMIGDEDSRTELLK